MMRVTVAAALVAATAAVAAAQSAPRVIINTADLSGARATTWNAMLDDLAKADVVFVGEQHDDPNTHLLELDVLKDLAKRRGDITLAMEMFERDVQDPLLHFSMGHMDEADFLKQSRPWPSYATDYKSLVDFAISKDIPVVASNVPRPIAAAVSKSGWSALDGKTDEERRWFAADRQCPTDDDYFKRFGEAMDSHPTNAPGAAPASPTDAAREGLERFYFAQCLKDETMGESIAQAYQAAAIGGKHPLVLHINGAFHSDYHEGTAERAARRLPGKRVVVVSIIPSTGDIDGVFSDRKIADYVVLTKGK